MAAPPITVESIPSVVPDWFDPSVPDFKPPATWVGAVVRVSVPITSSDPAREMAEAREMLGKRYPGATLHLVKDVDASYPASDPGATGSDEDMLRAYFATVQMPEGITVGQVIAYLKTVLPDTGLFGVQGVAFGITTAANTLCFESASIDMTKKGLTLVTGTRTDKNGKSNGSGKSSWVGLPFLALTGTTLKKQEHDEWSTRSNSLPAEVDSTVALPGGREMRVLRRRRPQSLRVWVDGAEQTMATPAQTQKHIERLTNLTWEVITNAVYIGQHETASAFGTDKERKELFSELLGLNRFLDAQAKIRRASTRLQREADGLAVDVAHADSGLIEASHGRAELVHSLKSAPKLDKSEVARLTKETAMLNKSIDGYTITRAKFDAEYRALTKDMREHENKASVAHGEHNALRRQRDDSSQAKGRCRLCGGIIAADKLAEYQAELKRGMDALDKVISKHGDDATKTRVRCSSVNDDIRLTDDQITASTRKLENVNKRLVQIESEAESANGVRRTLAEKDARIKKWRKTKAIHEDARAATLDERQFVDLCAAACGRDGMPAFLCAASVPRLNAASAVYCEAFESDVSVTFRAEADGVGIEVVNEDGGASFKDQSKGESSLAGIITALSFREALVPLGVLILDEPGEGLDAQSAEAFARGMNRVASRFGSAYVITHNAVISGALEPDRHVEVVKTGKVSVVREVV